VSQFLRPLELTPPKVIEGTTSDTAGEPTSVTIDGIVFDMVIINKSIDYSLYVSFDFGNTYIEIPPDSALPILFGSFANPLILIKSDGASQPYKIIYRLRLS